MDPRFTEETMARICVIYLLLDDLDVTEIVMPANLFDELFLESVTKRVEFAADHLMIPMNYSALNWASHVNCSAITKTKCMERILELYQVKQNCFQLYSPLAWIIRGFEPLPAMNSIKIAVYNSHRDVLDVLADYEDIPNHYRNHALGFALFWAVQYDQEDNVKFLLEKGANANFDRHGSIIQVALDAKNESIIQLLLVEGADINTRSGKNYDTALSVASGNGYESIVKLLLANGADVNICGRDSYTALIGAAAGAGGHEEIVRLLLENGADVNLGVGGFRGTALQQASFRGFDRIVELLLENGADVTLMKKEEKGGDGMALAMGRSG